MRDEDREANRVLTKKANEMVVTHREIEHFTIPKHTCVLEST